MLSLMTVVLPQHSGSSGTAKATGKATNITETTSSALGQADRNKVRETCECSCRVENMTKNNLPQRCPYLKGYMVEQTRHLHGDMSRMQHQHQVTQYQHPVTTREMESLREAACYWKEKYDRLYESQKRLQKVNEGLEEKLLKIAEKFEVEKTDLTKDVSDLTSRLVEARLNIAELEEENEQYRNDCNIAVRLLQCKPSNFVAHKFMSLPSDFQTKVKKHLKNQQNSRRSSSSGNSRSSPTSLPSSSSTSLLDQCHPDIRTIKVSVPTLPPAAIVYSVNQTDRGNQAPNYRVSSAGGTSSGSSEESTPDHVSAAIIAKVLEERSKERQTASATYKQRRLEPNQKGQVLIHTSTQTTNPNLCNRCNGCLTKEDKSLPLTSSDSSNVPMARHNQHQQGISISTETEI